MSVVVVVVGRLSVVTVLQGVQYPGLAAPSTTTLAPQHRHNTNVTLHSTTPLLPQLDNIKLNINYKLKLLAFHLGKASSPWGLIADTISLNLLWT